MALGMAVGGRARGSPRPYDPLRLCIFATVALLGWLGGPITLLVFALLGFVGYLRARRGGLRFSRCFLRDTGLVLDYLAGAPAAGAGGGAGRGVAAWRGGRLAEWRGDRGDLRPCAPPAARRLAGARRFP